MIINKHPNEDYDDFSANQLKTLYKLNKINIMDLIYRLSQLNIKWSSGERDN